MKVIVCGGRKFTGRPSDWLWCADRLRELGATEVVSGACSGADKIGEWAGLELELKVTKFPAEWGKHGKAAGPIRNREMAEYADACIAFPGGSGTENMLQEATRNNLIVIQQS